MALARIPSDGERDGQPDEEHVPDDGDDHRGERRHASGGRCRERQHDEVHHDVNHDAVEQSADDRLTNEEAELAANNVIGGGCAERDDEV